MGRKYSTHGEKRKAYKLLLGKSERKRPQARPRHKCENNIQNGKGRYALN
jgi:hypothetical protein